MTEETAISPILVPIDFSHYSEAILLKAIEFSKCMNAPIIVLHVVHDPAQMPGYYAHSIKEKHLHRIEDLAKEMLDDFLVEMAEKHPDLHLADKVEPMLVIGLPVTRILEIIDKIKPVMVVIGSKGDTGLKRLLVGSVAEQIVRLCPAPITIVKL